MQTPHFYAGRRQGNLSGHHFCSSTGATSSARRKVSHHFLEVFQRRTGIRCSILDLLDGIRKVGVQPVSRFCAEIVQAPLSLMSTQCYMLLKRAVENDRIDALVREMMRVARGIDSVVTLWFSFFETLKVSWRDRTRYFSTGGPMT
jgi:hypothetical protein